MLTAFTLGLNADSNATIKSDAVGGSGAGAFALGGSISLNDIDNFVDAHISGGSTIQVSGSFIINARDNSKIDALSGGAAGSGGVAIGVGTATNEISNVVTAYLDGARSMLILFQ